MIGFLEGKLRHKSAESIIIDVNGVGYVVQVPLSTFYDLPGLGETVSLHIHTHLREDALHLFGFRSSAEKEMFLYLITVNGVGPRLAVNILSGISPDGLRQAVLMRDPMRLKSIPGVGKKISERILLELRDKLKIQPQQHLPAAEAEDSDGVFADALSALINLGYRPVEAEKALRMAGKKLGEAPAIEDLLKESLKTLS